LIPVTAIEKYYTAKGEKYDPPQEESEQPKKKQKTDEKENDQDNANDENHAEEMNEMQDENSQEIPMPKETKETPKEKTVKGAPSISKLAQQKKAISVIGDSHDLTQLILQVDTNSFDFSFEEVRKHYPQQVIDYLIQEIKNRDSKR
jgi:outer membrane biosynthesis protein TonB